MSIVSPDESYHNHLTKDDHSTVTHIECENYILKSDSCIQSVKCERVSVRDTYLTEELMVLFSKDEDGTMINKKSSLVDLECKFFDLTLTSLPDPEDVVKLVREWGSTIPKFKCGMLLINIPASLMIKGDNHESWAKSPSSFILNRITEIDFILILQFKFVMEPLCINKEI